MGGHTGLSEYLGRMVRAFAIAPLIEALEMAGDSHTAYSLSDSGHGSILKV